VKNFGRKILDGGSVVDATKDEKIDEFEMKLVESFEFRRVGLRGLHEEPVAGSCGGFPPGRLAATMLCNYNC
jgi:hypothetical protein